MKVTNSTFTKIDCSNFKTKFAKNLYESLIAKWIEKRKAIEKDTSITYNVFLEELYYNINKYLWYKKIKYISGPELNIEYWFNKDFPDLEKFIFTLDCAYEARKPTLDVTRVLENKHITIITPNTYSAACKYGSGTKWCITSSHSAKAWHKYNTPTNKVFYFLPKNCNEKYVLYTGNNCHFTNKEDKSIQQCWDFISLLKDEWKLSRQEFKILFKELKKSLMFEAFPIYKRILLSYRNFYKPRGKQFIF